MTVEEILDEKLRPREGDAGGVGIGDVHNKITYSS